MRALCQTTRHVRKPGFAVAVQCRGLSSPWAAVAEVPQDPILGLVAQFKADPDPQKVGLAQGAYRTDDGEPFVLGSVKAAEAAVIAAGEDKEYLPIEGLASFRELSARFALGDDSKAVKEGRVACIQTLSGTGSLRVAADFLKSVAGVSTVWMPKPTWGNHKNVFATAGLTIKQYAYIDKKGTGLDFKGMVEDLSTASHGDAVLLHACAHNPTGVDPSTEQWNELPGLFVKHGLVPLFDSAYQGYATGDPVVDAASMRAFEAAGVPGLMVCQSYAKNMGLYGERVGALLVVCGSDAEQRAVLSQLKQIIVRPMWSSPPLHGARVAARLMGDDNLRQSWYMDLQTMSGRLRRMRQMLTAELRRIGAPGDWSHIEQQIGMFAYTGLSAEQVEKLQGRYHIYLTRDGRMSIAGLKPKDIEYVAAGLKDVTTET